MTEPVNSLHEETNDCSQVCHGPDDSSEGVCKKNTNLEDNQLRNAELEVDHNRLCGYQDNAIDPQLDLERESLSLDFVNGYIYDIDDEVENTKDTLCQEEIERKFQNLSFAFRTDRMTLPKRLIIRKRLRDLAELNVEKEINLMKKKLSNLRYLCVDSDSLQSLSDLENHLDVILATANYLSGAAEAYGFVQSEDKISGAISVVLQQIDCLERIQSELAKSSDMDQLDNKRTQLLPIFDYDTHEEKALRRRSVVTSALNGQTKRRASIASLPRCLTPSEDANGIYQNLSQCVASNRSSVISSRKISSCQPGTPKPPGCLYGTDQMYMRDKSYNTRIRKDSRTGEYELKFAQEVENDHFMGNGDNFSAESEEEMNIEEDGKSHLAVLRLSGTFESRTRKNSAATETLNIIDAFRNVLKWNVIMLKSSRFQFPEHAHQYVPFLMTWYMVILTVAIFTGGFFTGFNGFFTVYGNSCCYVKTE